MKVQQANKVTEVYTSRWVDPWSIYKIAATEWTEECIVIGTTVDRYLQWRKAWRAQEIKLQVHGILKYLR